MVLTKLKTKPSVRYYSPAEWNKLTKGQHNYLWRARIKTKAKEAKEESKTKIAALEATIQELSEHIRIKRKQEDDTSTTELETSDNTSTPTKKTCIKSTKRG